MHDRKQLPDEVRPMMKSTLVSIFVAASTAAVLAQNSGADWPQWRGPNRDGTVPNYAEPKALPEKLTQRWKVEVGSGYATPIVIGNRVFTFSRQEDKEVMRALDAANGKVI